MLVIREHDTRHLGFYESLWGQERGSLAQSDPNCVFDLSQNPSQRPSMTSRKGTCPCVTATFCSLWHAESRRFLLPQELALGMGWPCAAGPAQAAGVPIDACRDLYSVP